MKRARKCAVVFLLSATLGTLAVAGADRVQLDQDKAAAEAVDCLADPHCVALLRAQEAGEAGAQVAYERQPIEEKLAPWVLLIALGSGVWWWVGR